MRLLVVALFALTLVAPAVLAQTRSGEIASERKAQANLPQSRAPIWQTLRTTRITEDTNAGTFTAVHSPAVRALANTNVQISGFMLPLDTTPRSRHFMLAKLTPVCFFCPPGAPNEMVEVFSNAPIPITDRLVVVTGRFSLINDQNMGLFFRVSNAQASVAR